MKKHFPDISNDDELLKSDIIALQETWLEDDATLEEFNIPGYSLHLNCKGRGKGLATFFKSSIFKHDTDRKQEFIQLSKFNAHNIDVITLYRSQQCDLNTMNKLIKEMIEPGKPQLLVGDFNFCYLGETANSTSNFLQSANFKQLIKEPTHLEGNLLDQAYFKNSTGILTCTGKLHTKYYTDHKALALLIGKGKSRNILYNY